MLFLLLACVSAQPFNVGLQRPYGYGTPGPYALYPPRPVAPLYAPAALPTEDQFALFKANENVYISQRYKQAHRPLFTFPWADVFPGVPTAVAGLPYFGIRNEYQVAALKEDLIQDEIDYFRASKQGQPYTQEDINELNDLLLKRDAARASQNRRVTQAAGLEFSTTGAAVSRIFERQANSNNELLAKNELTDAREAYRKEPNAETLHTLKNAEDAYTSAVNAKRANTFDLFGDSFGTVGRIGHVLRKKSSQYDLEIVERDLRAARADFHKDPSEENWMKVRLANLALRATEEDDDANAADLVLGLFTDLPTGLISGSSYISSRNNDSRSRLWLRHARLQRELLLHQQAQKASEGLAKQPAQQNDETAQRLLGLSMYGSAPASL